MGRCIRLPEHVHVGVSRPIITPDAFVLLRPQLMRRTAPGILHGVWTKIGNHNAWLTNRGECLWPRQNKSNRFAAGEEDAADPYSYKTPASRSRSLHFFRPPSTRSSNIRGYALAAPHHCKRVSAKRQVPAVRSAISQAS
ncbi:hypothetical protein MRX96_042866 [Rhipicephalus microplus]